VAAIVEDRHGTVLHNFDAIQSTEVYKDYWPPFDVFSTVSFIKVRPGTDRQVLYDKMVAVCKEVYPYTYGQPFFDHLDMPRYDELFFRDTLGTFRHGDLKSIRTLSLVGLLLLLSSIFNYVNLSVALTGKRAKEMAVRRLAGASKGRIIGKYIAESVLFTAACFAAGLLLAEFFCPMLNRLLVHPDIPVRIVWSPGYILAYVGLIVIVGGISGVIPALMAGKHNALEVMKGGYRRKSKMVFSKVFIVLQNALSVVLIVWSITMERPDDERRWPVRCYFNTEDVFIFAFSPQEDPCTLQGCPGASFLRETDREMRKSSRFRNRQRSVRHDEGWTGNHVSVLRHGQHGFPDIQIRHPGRLRGSGRQQCLVHR
jgi:ABC-type antimicrobial peptide transport system, permease component